jgi:putative transposase
LWGPFFTSPRAAGPPEAVIREYIRNQEQEDSRLDQMNLWR